MIHLLLFMENFQLKISHYEGTQNEIKYMTECAL